MQIIYKEVGAFMLPLFKRFVSACLSQAGAHPCAAVPAHPQGCVKPPVTGTVTEESPQDLDSRMEVVGSGVNL